MPAVTRLAFVAAVRIAVASAPPSPAAAAQLAPITAPIPSYAVAPDGEWLWVRDVFGRLERYPAAR